MARRRDFTKARVARVQSEANIETRLREADLDRDNWVMCERCGKDIRKGEPAHRVNKKQSPSGFGGYVHEECTSPPKEVEVSTDNNPVRSPSQIATAAKDVWAAMVAECKKNGLNTVTYEGRSGWFIQGSVTDYARKLWPRTNFSKSSGKTAMNLIRQFLRGSGNVVVMESTADRRRSRIFVASSWREGTAVPVFVTPPSRAQVAAANKDKEAKRREAKVTPEEAGETREPEPIEVKEGTIVHPEYGAATQHPDISFVIRFANGMCQCRWEGCGRVLKPQGVFAHAASHRANEKDMELESVQKENERLNRALLGQFDPDQAMDMMRTYIQSLRKAVDVATDNITELEMENANLKEEQALATVALDSEVAAKVDLIKEVMTKFQNGEIKVLRAMSDISDILEA